MSPTCRCGRPVDGATLCRRCAGDTLGYALANIAAHHADLDTIRTRQARYGAGGPKARGRETPLVVDGRFTDPTGEGAALAWETPNTVTTWARVLHEDHPATIAPNADTVGACCAYLLRMSDRIRVADYGPELLDELADLERRLARFVDRPAERWYAGQCSAEVSQEATDGALSDAHPPEVGHEGSDQTKPADGHTEPHRCTAELYAYRESGTITCPICGTEHDVAARRAYLLAESEHMLLTAAEAARAVVVWSDYERGEHRLVDRIRRWAERGRITTRGHVGVRGNSRALYRLGDVLDLLAADTHRQQTRGRSA